jgi:DNA-binding transcriptional LysR family regulator
VCMLRNCKALVRWLAGIMPCLLWRILLWRGSRLLEHVRSGALDMALVYGPTDSRLDANTTSHCLGTIPLVFVAPGARRRPRVRALTEVATESWVLNPEGCGFRAIVRALLESLDAPLQVAVEAHGIDLQLALVARGAGVSLVPQASLRRSRVRAQVHTFRVQGHDCRLGVWLVSGRLPTVLTPVVTMLHAQLARLLRHTE